MLARLKMLWVVVRDSLWFLPGTMTAAAAALALLMIQLEREGTLAAGGHDHWLLGGGADGARDVLGAIAGGLITVTGVVFSVTIVALQLASSQFTPRVLRNFTADRANQLVLGVFIGTFTYALIVLRVVRSETSAHEPFVPRVSVALAMLLVLVSIGFLIYFVNHAARSIQVSVILERVAGETVRHVRRLFPEAVERGATEAEPGRDVPDAEPARVMSAGAGYVQAVDGDALFELGVSSGVVIHMECDVGEYLLPGRPLASLWPAERCEDETVRKVRRAVVVGPERTPAQDVEFGIIEISDIAIKALSPSVNDPTTALHCIDRLGEILLALGTRAPPPDRRTREGRVPFVARPLRFEQAVGHAFDQIRHFGAGNPTIAKKLVDALTQLLEEVPEQRHPALLAQRDAVLADAAIRIESPVDRRDLERLARKKVGRPGE